MRNLLNLILALFIGLFLSASVFGQITLPWSQDFETITPGVYTANTNPIPGLPATADETWRYEQTNVGILVVDQANIESTCDASSMGHLVMSCSADNIASRNDVIVTLDMSAYTIGDNVELSFDYAAFSQLSDFGEDAVFVRGSNTDTWLRAIDFSLESSISSNGACHPIQKYKVDQLLASGAQNYSSTFEIRFGYRDEDTPSGYPTPPFSPFSGSYLLYDNVRLEVGTNCKSCHYTVSTFPYEEDFDLDVTFNGTVNNCFTYFPFQS